MEKQRKEAYKEQISYNFIKIKIPTQKELVDLEGDDQLKPIMVVAADKQMQLSAEQMNAPEIRETLEKRKTENI